MYRMTPAAVRRVAGLGSLGQDVSEIFDKLTSDMKQQAIERAGAQLGLSVALNSIPVVGQAASIVLAAVSTLVGGMYERAGKEEMASFQVECNQKVAAADLIVQNALTAAISQEKDAAIQLAMSSDPLAGLGSYGGYGGTRMRPVRRPLRPVGMGDFWSNAVDAAKNSVQTVTKVVVQAVPTPVTKAVTRVTAVAAPVVNRVNTVIQPVTSKVNSDLAHNAINPLKPARAIVQLATTVVQPLASTAASIIPGQAIYQLTPLAPILLAAQAASKVASYLPSNAVTDLLKKPQEQIDRASGHVDEGIDVVSGRSGLESVRAAIEKARALVTQQLADQVRTNLANIASPEYRQQLRIQLAQLIRKNMAFQMLQPTPGSITSPVTSVPALPKTAKNSLIIAGAVGAAFLFFGH
jgi:hypothetical protein